MFGPKNLYMTIHNAWMAQGLRVNSPCLGSCRNPGPMNMCKGTERVNDLEESINQTNLLLGSDKLHISQVIDEKFKHQNVLQPFNVFQLTI